jgi:preprotein translocase subunit SecE
LGGANLFGTYRQTQAGRKDQKRMAKLNPIKFFQEVRQETNKVTWPSRRETAITTAMVFIFAAVSAVFFLLADQVIRIVVTLVLGIAS